MSMPYGASKDWPRHILWGHYTPQAAWRAKDVPVFLRGEGCYVFDAEGRRFFDGISSLFCTQIGHGRADLARVAASQMETLAFMPNWSAAHEPALDAAALISARAPGDLDTVFFVNSGAEANEFAMKFAVQLQLSRGFKNRNRFLTRNLAYHGSSLGALGLTALAAYQHPFEQILSPTGRRIPNTSKDYEGFANRPASCDEIIAVIESEGPETIAAIFAEPVQNGGGALVPRPGYWKTLREICDHYRILLVADEVITGFGRLGAFFGIEKFGVIPDLLTFAKGASSGYMPIGGLIARRALAQELLDSQEMFSHGATWGAHPVATAVVAANIRIFEAERVLANVNDLAAYWEQGLKGLAERHAIVKEVRGAGFLHAIELMRDRKTNEELSSEDAKDFVTVQIPAAFRTSGSIFRADNRGGTLIVIAPPLVAKKTELSDALADLDQILGWLADKLQDRKMRSEKKANAIAK